MDVGHVTFGVAKSRMLRQLEETEAGNAVGTVDSRPPNWIPTCNRCKHNMIKHTGLVSIWNESQCYLHCNSSFPDKPRSAGFTSVFFLHLFWRKPFRISGTGFLPAKCLSCHQSNSVKAPKSINCNMKQPPHHHNRFMALFPGPSGWAGPRKELQDFMEQGEINRGRHMNHMAGRHSIRTNQCPPPPSPHMKQEKKLN